MIRTYEDVRRFVARIKLGRNESVSDAVATLDDAHPDLVTLIAEAVWDEWPEVSEDAARLDWLESCLESDGSIIGYIEEVSVDGMTVSPAYVFAGDGKGDTLRAAIDAARDAARKAEGQ